MPPITRSQSAKAEAEANVGRQPVVDKESESELGLPPQKRRRSLDKPVKDEVSNKKSKVNKKAKKKALTGKGNKRKRNVQKSVKQIEQRHLRTIHKRIDRDRAKIGNISQQPSPQSSILMDQAGNFQQDSEEETLDTSQFYDISTPSKNSSNLDNVRSRSLSLEGTNEPNQSNKSKRRNIRNEAHSEMSSDLRELRKESFVRLHQKKKFLVLQKQKKISMKAIEDLSI